MKLLPLKDIAEFIRTGKTPPTEEAKYFNGDIHWYSPGDLDKGKILTEAKRNITPLAFEDKKAVSYPQDTLLVTCIGEIGKLGITSQTCSSNQQITAIKTKKNIDVNYLFYWFKKNKLILRDLANSAVVPILNNRNLERVQVAVPPLEEQKKIAEILDVADNLRQKDQQLVDHYDRLSQSLFLNMFGDPVTNSMGWKVDTLNKGISDIVGGKSVGGEERPLNSGEMAVIKISAVTTGNFKANKYKVVNADSVPQKIVTPHKGDLLFSRANTRPLVGATCIVNADYNHLFLPDKIWRLDLNNDLLSSWYLKLLLSHDGFRGNLRKVATGTSGDMLNISKAKLKALKIPLPPIALQNQFSLAILDIEKQKTLAQQSLKKSDELFNSLLQKAFKGELTAS